MEFNENHLTTITQIEERCKSNTHRIEDAEADIKELKEKNNALYEINANIRTLSEGILTVKTDIQEVRVEQGEMKSDIADLKNAPDKTKAGIFTNVSKLIFTSIVTGIVAFILGVCFPSIFK